MNNSEGNTNGRSRRPLVIAGTASGVGKTTIATGLIAAYRRRGLTVAPFKVGPDYIDPGYHEEASGRRSRNLDTWLSGAAAVRANFARGAAGADVSIIEGAMGLFDGRAGAGNEGSTAEVARLVGGVVILVVDCGGMSRSLAALLKGFTGFDRELDIAGVILNNVGSSRHARMLLEAAAEVGVTVLGTIQRQPDLALASRHLGLVPAAESDREQVITALADAVAAAADLERLQALATPLPADWAGFAAGTPHRSETRVKLAVARDDAFSFYYADGLEALEAAGADIVCFSPLRDNGLPACDGVYLGGGFPEMFAARLASNRPMRESLAAAAGAGLPVYAECGGLIYLCEAVAVEGEEWSMAGVLPFKARMTDRRQALGYVEATARRDSILFPAGEKVRGHEFHWSEIDWREEYLAYDCVSSRSDGSHPDGYCDGNILASYLHINFSGNPAATRRFIESCRQAKGALTGAA